MNTVRADDDPSLLKSRLVVTPTTRRSIRLWFAEQVQTLSKSSVSPELHIDELAGLCHLKKDEWLPAATQALNELIRLRDRGQHVVVVGLNVDLQPRRSFSARGLDDIHSLHLSGEPPSLRIFDLNAHAHCFVYWNKRGRVLTKPSALPNIDRCFATRSRPGELERIVHCAWLISFPSLSKR